MVGIFKRLLGYEDSSHEGPVAPKSKKGSEFVDLASNMLMTQIDLGNALPGCPNRQRLGKPYARGYMFGFLDAFLQKAGVTDEIEALALITIAHTRLLGVDAGSSFVREALANQAPDSIFTNGRAKGGADVYRWLSDNNVPPLVLTDYLNGSDVPAGTE
jgi:hypothetical protein